MYIVQSIRYTSIYMSLDSERDRDWAFANIAYRGCRFVHRFLPTGDKRLQYSVDGAIRRPFCCMTFEEETTGQTAQRSAALHSTTDDAHD